MNDFNKDDVFYNSIQRLVSYYQSKRETLQKGFELGWEWTFDDEGERYRPALATRVDGLQGWVKFKGNESFAARNEFLVAELALLTGVPVPPVTFYDKDGDLYSVSLAAFDRYETREFRNVPEETISRYQRVFILAWVFYGWVRMGDHGGNSGQNLVFELDSAQETGNRFAFIDHEGISRHDRFPPSFFGFKGELQCYPEDELQWAIDKICSIPTSEFERIQIEVPQVFSNGLMSRSINFLEFETSRFQLSERVKSFDHTDERHYV